MPKRASDNGHVCSYTEPTNAFDRMRLASALQQRLQSKAQADEACAAEARAAEQAAVMACEAAEAQAAASKAAAAGLGPQQKKQKTTADSSSGGVEAEAAEAAATDDEPTWKLWPLSRWRKHESEVQARRAVVIDINNADESLPPRGDEERGWHKHWRRGLIGSIQDWAEGSKHRVVFMLAEMARYFGVEQEVYAACVESPSPALTPTCARHPHVACTARRAHVSTPRARLAHVARTSHTRHPHVARKSP